MTYKSQAFQSAIGDPMRRLESDIRNMLAEFDTAKRVLQKLLEDVEKLTGERGSNRALRRSDFAAGAKYNLKCTHPALPEVDRLDAVIKDLVALQAALCVVANVKRKDTWR